MTEQEIRDKAEAKILKCYGFTGEDELQKMINLFIDGYNEAMHQINLTIPDVRFSKARADVCKEKKHWKECITFIDEQRCLKDCDFHKQT